VNNTKYSSDEYTAALVTTLGLIVFKLSEAPKTPARWQASMDSHFHAANFPFLIGVALLAAYLVCDSFTSNWQSKVYKQYKVTAFQMMEGMNVCSMFVSLFICFAYGQFWSGLAFVIEHQTCLVHIVFMSLFSAIGQIFIFKTIAEFGPVVFSVITIIRQLLSVLLSVVLFGHRFAAYGFFGLAMIFGSLGYKMSKEQS